MGRRGSKLVSRALAGPGPAHLQHVIAYGMHARRGRSRLSRPLCSVKWHKHGFRILSATLLISEILAANISKYAAYAIRKDRDNEKYATHANSKVCVN